MNEIGASHFGVQATGRPQVDVTPDQLNRGRPMQTVPVKTSPAPNPLPNTWLRAIANSITTEFRRTGWQRYKISRAIHPTGNPRTGADRVTTSVPKSDLLSNTEVIEQGFHLTGTVDPIPSLEVPAMAWRINQMHAVGALSDRPDLHEPLNTLCKRSRRDQPFQMRDNRHGNPTLRPNHTTTHEERTAITLISAAATIVTIDEHDYWDWLTADFNAQAVLDLLKETACPHLKPSTASSSTKT